jgi:hypothetical protein
MLSVIIAIRMSIRLIINLLYIVVVATISLRRLFPAAHNLAATLTNIPSGWRVIAAFCGSASAFDKASFNFLSRQTRLDAKIRQLKEC